MLAAVVWVWVRERGIVISMEREHLTEGLWLGVQQQRCAQR